MLLCLKNEIPFGKNHPTGYFIVNIMKFSIGKINLRYILAIIIAALNILGYFYQGKLWATSGISFAPLLWQIVFWAAFCLLLFDEVLSVLDRAFRFLGDLLFKRLGGLPRAALLFAIGAVLIYIFRARHFLWGDSHVIVRYVEEFAPGNIFIIRRYFVEFLYWLTVKVFSPLGGDVYDVLMLLHALFGGFFLLIAALFADAVGEDSRQKFAAFLAVVASSLFLLFTHIELYAPGVVFALWGITLLIKNYEKRGFSRFIFVFPLAVAILFYPLYAYFAVLIPLFLIKEFDKRLIAIALTIAAFVIIFFAGRGAEFEAMRFFLPNSFPQYCFSTEHLLLIINFVLFLTPAVFAVFSKVGKLSSGWNAYLSALGITSILVILPLFFELGALDWDIASLLLLPLILYSAYRVCIAKPKLRAFLLGAAILFCCTEAWLNIENERGESRAENIVLRQKTPYFLYNRSPIDRIVMINIYQPERFWDPFKVYYWGENLIMYEPQHIRPYLYMMSFNQWSGRDDWAAYYALKAIHSGKVGKDMIPKLMRFFEKSLVREIPTLDELEAMLSDGGPFSLEADEIAEIKRLAFSDEMPAPDRERSMEEILRICLYMNQMGVAGHFDVVDAVYIAGKKLYPCSGNLELIYGAILLIDKRPMEANNALRKSYNLGGDRGSIFSNMGLVCAMLEDIDKGLIIVDKAVRERPWLASYRCNYALLLNAKEGPDAAHKYLLDFAQKAYENGFSSEGKTAADFSRTFAPVYNPTTGITPALPVEQSE